MKDKLDIIMVFETKLFDSFPQGKFQIEDYSTYRKDTNDKGGGIILFVREDIPSYLNVKSGNWLISCLYNLHRSCLYNPQIYRVASKSFGQRVR